MSKRRKSREVALQFLYQLDLHSEADPSRHGAEFWERHPVDADTRAFADALVRGTKTNQAKIDQVLSQFAEHWDLERMSVVDRNILRLRSEEHTSELQSRPHLVCRLLLEKKKNTTAYKSESLLRGIG